MGDVESDVQVTLRAVEPSDLDVFFQQQLDPEAILMAAFTAADPSDRAAFDAHWRRILANDSVTNRTIMAGEDVAGHVAVFPSDDLGGHEITYWIGRTWWGRGVATTAVALLLDEVPTRPLFGRCAETNPASRRVLEKCGFTVVGQDEGFANAHNKVIGEDILRLDA